MNDKVFGAIKKYNMIVPGDHLAVGVSGGADSVALLHFLREIADSLRLSLTALHLNHQLRGAESNRDEAFVRRLCWDWHIPLVAKSAPVNQLAQQSGLSLEACAREVRYDFFQRSAANGGKVATAHTLSDNAETVLLNLTRGAALRGLCGIPPVRDNIVRPLILCTRREVEEYCREHALDYVTDSTNLDDAFTRNRLRHNVVPVLTELNPGWHGCVAGMVEALREDADYLDSLAADALEEARREEDLYDRAGILELPKPLLMRVILHMLRERGIPVDRRRLEQVRGALEAGTGGAQLSGRWICRVTESEFLFVPADDEKRISIPPIELTYPFEDKTIPILPGKTLHISVLSGAIFKESINNREIRFKNAIDCDRIDRIVKLRCREPGDSIRITGRGLTKSLKKLMNEESVPLQRRSETLVLSGEGGVFWVEGFGTAETAAVGEQTKRVMLIRLAEEE